MATPFAKGLLKIAVAQICQNIGWNAVQSTPLELLVDILHRHLLELSKATHDYSNQYGRSEPNLVDLDLAFRSMGVELQELEEYISSVEPVPFAHKVAAFPVSHASNLQFPKQGSREVANRPEWIPDYLPLMNPGLEEEEPVLPESLDEMKKESWSVGQAMSPASPGSGGEELNDPLSPRTGHQKRPPDPSDALHPNKTKSVSEEEGRPMREVASVFMTPSGIITFARDSKLPDPRPPAKMVESRPPSPATSSSSESLPSPKTSKDSKRDKAKLLKLKKNFVMKKPFKKMKLSKKEGKENSDKSSKHTDLFLKKNTKFGDDLMRLKSKKKSSKDFEKSSKNRPGIGKIKIAKDVRMKPNKEFSVKSQKSRYKIPKSPSRVATFTAFPRSPKSPKGLKSPKVQPMKVKALPEKPAKPVDNMPVKIEPLQNSMQVHNDIDDEISRDDTPEPRLVIDDEAQARQEREGRLAVLDECIDAVIHRARTEIESECVESDRKMDAAIDAVVKSSAVKKLEPRDVYDFTDSSDGSNPPTPKTPETPSSPPPPPPGLPRVAAKKEKKCSPEPIPMLSPEPSKKRKSKSKKKKGDKANNKAGKLEQSPVLIGESDESSEELQSFPSPGPSSFANQTSPTSLFAALSVQKFPGLGFNQGPFSPVRSLPSNPFPTPPLFGPPIKAEAIPMNVTLSPPPLSGGQSSLANIKTAAEKKGMPPLNLSVPVKEPVKEPDKKLKVEADEVDKPSKGKKKESKKDKSSSKRKGGRERSKEKPKKEEEPAVLAPLSPPPPPPPPAAAAAAAAPPATPPMVAPPAPPPPPPLAPTAPDPTVTKEALPSGSKTSPVAPVKAKPKAEKKGRGKTKGRAKVTKEEKEDPSSVPKITLKLGSGGTQASTPGSTKIVIKSLSKGASESNSPVPHDSPPPPVAPVTAPAPVAPPIAPLAAPPSPPPHVISPQLAPGISGTRGRHGGRGRGAAKRVPSPIPPPSCTVITETLGTIVDESGNKIWICPACTRPDDGSPMIGCDECDDWYHWVCVGIVVPPKEEESWFCSRCITKRQSPLVKRKRKKHKRDK